MSTRLFIWGRLPRLPPGGWVIRIGDSNLSPLPALANFFDYCRSEMRADWMDIFLLANCRFMLGTNSGPCFVPALRKARGAYELVSARDAAMAFVRHFRSEASSAHR